MDSQPTATPNAAMRLRELAFSAASAAAVRAAVRLGVPDALGDTPTTAGELAAAVDADPQALRRLLRALTCQGVFAEDGEGRFVHTETSRLLREDTPRSMRYVSLWTTEPWTWAAWPLLDEAVRRGGHVFDDLFGKGFFEYLHEDAPESAEVFNRAMTHSSRQSAQDIAEMLDLRGVATVADIGGGQGHVLAGLLERNPDLRGALLDLPDVVAKADPRLLPGGALAPRVQLVGGDCRREIPVQADLYIIKNILEWDDSSTRATLRNAVAAARPGARVLVIENLVDDSASMPFTAAMDLLLLLNVGGRKHTTDSLVALMEEAGLKVGDVRPVNPYLHAFDGVVPE
ncbi:acetylserotonin O-methyltransferase [Streptacidiphilus griseoplanus]|uniref:acetylserotonin O-methyltransferase n=1 Tax=Peterkaempfera griseoplana TaxID=66896 RepID=UPI000A936DAE|nr:acetylserotonin O-methyltransferase [Peterkaempfera griseoplana]